MLDGVSQCERLRFDPFIAQGRHDVLFFPYVGGPWLLSLGRGEVLQADDMEVRRKGRRISLQHGPPEAPLSVCICTKSRPLELAFLGESHSHPENLATDLWCLFLGSRV